MQLQNIIGRAVDLTTDIDRVPVKVYRVQKDFTFRL